MIERHFVGPERDVVIDGIESVLDTTEIGASGDVLPDAGLFQFSFRAFVTGCLVSSDNVRGRLCFFGLFFT